MTIHYNRAASKHKRQQLRRDMTDAEKRVWMFLRKRQVNGIKFRRQYGIDRFIIDFYCPKFKIAIEIDGDIHEEKFIKERDEERQRYLEQFGVKFLRIKNDEVFENLDRVFARIEKFILVSNE